MLEETLAQPLIFVMLMLLGFLSGTIYDASNFVWKLAGQNKIFRHFLDFFATLLVCGVFFLTVLDFNFGEFRLYEPCVFFLLLGLERITIGKIVEKFLDLCYKQFVRFTKFIQKKRNKKDDQKPS